MLQAHWGSCTSLHPLLYVNEHKIIICRNTAATAHRSIISSVSLRQYITLFIFPYFYQFCFTMRQMLGLMFTMCVLCPGYHWSVSLYACVDHTILATPTVWATTGLLLFTDSLSYFTFQYNFQLHHDQK